MKVSPLAPAEMPAMPPVDGVRLAVAAGGLRYKDRPDVLLALFDPGTTVGGVLTRSRCPSAPVEWCRDRLAAGTARALVVNAGNANAFTGLRGRSAVDITAKAAAKAAGCEPDAVFLASTGVIGEPLDPAPFESLLAEMATRAAPDGYADAAAAIMTTDTFAKVATRTVGIGETHVTINGIAKGSGMIAPDMATMLSFLFTDAPIAAPVLEKLVRRLSKITYNAITVDSDTSTSDTVLLFATGKAEARGVAPITDMSDPRLPPFKRKLRRVMKDLALQIVRDGEGASKLVKIAVSGAETSRGAEKIARAIANSPLVKTAIAGEDPNWGRVVMAVGKAGQAADRDRLSIWFGPHEVARGGERHPDYDEETVAAYMKNDEIDLSVDLGIGAGKARIWTCDLTHDYISINADYRS